MAKIYAWFEVADCTAGKHREGNRKKKNTQAIDANVDFLCQHSFIGREKNFRRDQNAIFGNQKINLFEMRVLTHLDVGCARPEK